MPDAMIQSIGSSIETIYEYSNSIITSSSTNFNLVLETITLPTPGVYRVEVAINGTCNSTYNNNIYQDASLRHIPTASSNNVNFYASIGRFNPKNNIAQVVDVSGLMYAFEHIGPSSTISLLWQGGYGGGTNSINISYTIKIVKIL